MRRATLLGASVLACMLLASWFSPSCRSSGANVVDTRNGTPANGIQLENPVENAQEGPAADDGATNGTEGVEESMAEHADQAADGETEEEHEYAEEIGDHSEESAETDSGPPTPTAGDDEEVQAPSVSGIPAPPAEALASYSAEPVALPPAYQGPDLDLPAPLDAVTFLDGYELGETQRDLLSANGFVVVPTAADEFYDVYRSTDARELPVYITTDAMLHVYHLLFDKVLRDLEDQQFATQLEALTLALEDAAREQYQEARGTALEEEALRVMAYFCVARQLISAAPPVVSGPAVDLVSGELTRIRGNAGMALSGLMSFPATEDHRASEYWQDYSQFIPRGHYTRSELRKRYFLAMMWYGRLTFRLAEPRETLMALMIARLLQQTEVDGKPALDSWAGIYDPTAFLVGNADDLGVRQYLPVMRMVYGPALELPQLERADLLEQFRSSSALPAPAINPTLIDPRTNQEIDMRGFRFMGQRFVLDSYIFEELLWKKVGTEDNRRELPVGLDVFAAFGNDTAYAILDELGETDYANYDSQLAKVCAELRALGPVYWRQNVYWHWLHVLEAVQAAKGAVYPTYMQTQAWARKDLHSALGSWAELKHDTILYAKQHEMYAGMAPPPEVPFIRSWVEPNPTAFARMLALARLTESGLSERGLLAGDCTHILEAIKAKLTFLKNVAERELQGAAITEQENDELREIGDWLFWMVELSADVIPDERVMYGENELEEEPAAIIADVATGGLDPATGELAVLEVATGRVYDIYVITPAQGGGWQLARGGVYSYYEFKWPSRDRLTDEKWREMLAAGEQPAQPDWTEAFIAE